MNDLKDKNKLSIGQTIVVNPEANFAKNPRGGYQNRDNPDGVEQDVPSIAAVGIGFIVGGGQENTIIIGGDALNSVKNWDVVKNLVNSSVTELKDDGKLIPGEVAYREFRPGNLPTNIKKGISEAWDKITNGENPWKNNSQNSPIHVIGSFNLTVRINANGTMATVCVYDSKTFKSFSDGNASTKTNRSRGKSKNKAFTNSYQRYLWNINLQ
jgi:hypothetical protein